MVVLTKGDLTVKIPKSMVKVYESNGWSRVEKPAPEIEDEKIEMKLDEGSELDENSEPDTVLEDIDSLTMEQLYEVAASYGIDLLGATTKKEIRKRIKSALQ